MAEEKCFCCGSGDVWSIVTRLPSFLFGVEAEIVKCGICGLGRTIPEPMVDRLHYVSNVRYDDLFYSRRHLYLSVAKDLLNSLGKASIILPGKRLLDVASGGGFLVEVAKEMGFDAEGIEINAGMVEWCRSRGLNIRHGDVISLEAIKDANYHVIVLSAILEHVPDPVKFIERCKKMLIPGGVLLVSQASFDGLLPKLFPWGWYGWQPLEHYWHFTPSSFIALANKNGLSVLNLKRGSLYHPWFLRGNIKELIGRNIAAVLARAGELLRSGDSFTVVAVANTGETND